MSILTPKFPYANNSVDTAELYKYRALYRDKVLRKETGEIEDAVTDLWYGKNLYGKINHLGDFIVPKDNLLGYLKNRNNEDTYFAVGFVAEAYNEMITAIKGEYIYKTNAFVASPYTNFTVEKAYVSINDTYRDYMNGIYVSLMEYLSLKENSNKVKNFGDFIDQFFNFYNLMDALSAPLSLSGYVGSRMCPNLVSGMMVEISDKPYGDDKIKYNTFVNDDSFKLFQYYASNYGFTIDKNIPWRIIANLNSCYMKNKMSKNLIYYDPSGYLSNNTIAGLSMQDAMDFDNVFDVYYFKTYQLDIKYLKFYLEHMYRSYVEDFPFYETYSSLACSSDTQQLFKVRKKRKVLDFEEESKYTLRDFWLQRYFMLRITETKAVFSAAEVNYILFNAKKIYDIYGQLKSLNFLNQKLKKRHKHLYDRREIGSMPVPASSCEPPVRPIQLPPMSMPPNEKNNCL